MPDTDTNVANGTSTQGSATPSGGNSGDSTAATQGHAATTVTDAIQSATPATTRSDDTRGAGFDFTKLIDSLDSLPDRVANAVREAAPAPVTQSAPATTSDSTNTNGSTAGDASNGAGANNGDNSAARKRSFAEKWFGL